MVLLLVHGWSFWWSISKPLLVFSLVLSLSWTTSTLGIQDGQTVVREQEGQL